MLKLQIKISLLIISSILPCSSIKSKPLSLKTLEEKYNLTNSKHGRDGIESTLNILLNQEEQAMKIRPAVIYPKNYIAALASNDGLVTKVSLPSCEVSYGQIMRNGLFVYLGNVYV